MKTCFFSLCIFYLTCFVPATCLSEQADTAVQIIKGIVVEQIHGCEVDGQCSVVVKTEKGTESVIWGAGMLPSNCSSGDANPSDDASYLIPGDKVEIHVPVASQNFLCGPGASVTRLDIPAPKTRIISGNILQQNLACMEQRPGPCSVVVHTDAGDQEVVWQKEKSLLDFGSGCRRVKASRVAALLRPNDQVKITLPLSSDNVLCGDGASLTIIPDPVDPAGLRTIDGVITRNADCHYTDAKNCILTIQTEKGTEELIYGFHKEPHPIGCHFLNTENMDSLSSLSVNDEVEIHVPVSSKNILCGNGAAITKLTVNPYRAQALAFNAGFKNSDSSVRVTRGIVEKNDSYGISVETGLEVAKLRFSGNPANGCYTNLGVVQQLVPFKRGDKIEIRVAASSPPYLCNGAIITRLD